MALVIRAVGLTVLDTRRGMQAIATGMFHSEDGIRLEEICASTGDAKLLVRPLVHTYEECLLGTNAALPQQLPFPHACCLPVAALGGHHMSAVACHLHSPGVHTLCQAAAGLSYGGIVGLHAATAAVQAACNCAAQGTSRNTNQERSMLCHTVLLQYKLWRWSSSPDTMRAISAGCRTGQQHAVSQNAVVYNKTKVGLQVRGSVLGE